MILETRRRDLGDEELGRRDLEMETERLGGCLEERNEIGRLSLDQPQ